MVRSSAVQEFLNAAETSLNRVTGPGAGVAQQVVARWKDPRPSHAQPVRLPVCDWIVPALATSAPCSQMAARLSGVTAFAVSVPVRTSVVLAVEPTPLPV